MDYCLTKNEVKSEFRRLMGMIPQTRKCSIKDSKGRNCPGTPVLLSEFRGEPCYLCVNCEKNVKLGFYE